MLQGTFLVRFNLVTYNQLSSNCILHSYLENVRVQTYKGNGKVVPVLN